MKYTLLTTVVLAVLLMAEPVSAQLHIPPDPLLPHGNLCPLSLNGVNDVSLESIRLYNMGTALRLENGLVLTPQSTDRNGATSYLLYMAYGSTIQLQPVSIGGNGWVLDSTPLGDPFPVSCDVTNVSNTVNFVAQVSFAAITSIDTEMAGNQPDKTASRVREVRIMGSYFRRV
ncbi:MAG: hypothetical protein M3069_14825, partial [Chloroflexota bacterium]|nr:hypothetical protein [Chloroflexota bacterium]